jgi:hypothetical protein
MPLNYGACLIRVEASVQGPSKPRLKLVKDSLHSGTAKVALQRHALARIRPATATDRSRNAYQRNPHRMREICGRSCPTRSRRTRPGACRKPVTNRVPILTWQPGCQGSPGPPVRNTRGPRLQSSKRVVNRKPDFSGATREHFRLARDTGLDEKYLHRSATVALISR